MWKRRESSGFQPVEGKLGAGQCPQDCAGAGRGCKRKAGFVCLSVREETCSARPEAGQPLPFWGTAQVEVPGHTDGGGEPVPCPVWLSRWGAGPQT